MKYIINLARRWLRNSPGFTLAELMIAMAVGGLVIGGVFAVWTQLFNVTATNSNYMTAFRQVQNGGDWISRDALMTQGVYDMAQTDLDGGIDDDPTLDTIQVNSTDGFPPSGVICISALGTDSEDELIWYNSKTGNTFEDCTRGDNATAHDNGKSVTVFVSLNWTDWNGNQHQVVYNLKEISRQLIRSYFTNGSLIGSTIIAEAIVVDETETSSEWNYDEKELEVKITASVGGYVLGKHGVQSETATRIYKVNPRPFF